jgi:hypothetical protein
MNNMAVYAGGLNFKMAVSFNMVESLNIAAFVNLQEGRYRGNSEL